jgi:hypothetical protein
VSILVFSNPLPSRGVSARHRRHRHQARDRDHHPTPHPDRRPYRPEPHPQLAGPAGRGPAAGSVGFDRLGLIASTGSRSSRWGPGLSCHSQQQRVTCSFARRRTAGDPAGALGRISPAPRAAGVDSSPGLRRHSDWVPAARSGGARSGSRHGRHSSVDRRGDRDHDAAVMTRTPISAIPGTTWPPRQRRS